MAVKNAVALLDGFCAEGIAVEVTPAQSAACSGWRVSAPLRAEVAPPRRLTRPRALIDAQA